MGNPKQKHAKPLPANSEAVAAIALLGALDQAITVEQQQGLIASAGVRAQLAVAYELNTIGRLLALNADRTEKHERTDNLPGYEAHNAILERLGL